MPASSTHDAAALLCITPSPAIDRTAYVQRIEVGAILRPHELVVLPGGKGVNAARAAAHLGGHVITTGIAGGHAGAWIVEALAEEGLRPRFSTAAAESRTTYVTVADDGATIVVYERPGLASAGEFEDFLALLEQDALPECGMAIVAGSVPAGIGPEGHARIVDVCRHAERPLLVDASGDGLVAVMDRSPDMVKIGRIEAVEAGLVEADASTLDAATSLADRGAGLAIVTDGSRRVAAADDRQTWLVEVPDMVTVNAVGSGDAFNAGFAMARLDGSTIDEALRWGVAAGSANALTLGAGMLDPDVALELRRAISVTAAER